MKFGIYCLLLEGASLHNSDFHTLFNSVLERFVVI
jgi:hypothetical protein